MMIGLLPVALADEHEVSRVDTTSKRHTGTGSVRAVSMYIVDPAPVSLTKRIVLLSTGTTYRTVTWTVASHSR